MHMQGCGTVKATKKKNNGQAEVNENRCLN